MIYSDKQYNISSGELAKLKDALDVTEARPTGDKWIWELEIAGLKSQIAEIEAEIAHYDLLKAGDITFSRSYSLDALPSILIQARIAAGMTQSDLAKEIGLKPQQIQRYEASEYMGASLSRLIEISSVLNVHIEGHFDTSSNLEGIVFSWFEPKDVVWSELPINEMKKRKWFDAPRGSNLIEQATEYVLEAAGRQFVTALHRKKMRGTTTSNGYALLAWQARVLELAKLCIEDEQLPAFNNDKGWLADLAKLTRRKDGPKRSKKLLAENGIVFVTERHLPGTFLDGGAMLATPDHPVVGLTLRHDRLDNFWFTLFHELGHVYLHLFDGLRYDFFDDDDSSATDRIELEADQFALDCLIPGEQWDKCMSRFALSEEAVRLDAKKLAIDASIIAGRIRKELGNYTILTELVGHGLARDQFKKAADDLDR